MKQSKEILNLLFRIQRKVHQQLRDSEVSFPLSRAEMMALKMIEENDNVTISSISEAFGIRKSSASCLIHQLKSKKLVVLETSLEDKRLQFICLTEESGDVLKKMQELMSVFSEYLLHNLTDQEKNSLLEILKKVTE